ncbi:MAG: hypothetical protein K0R99_28 [Microbacterium sp.]|jgi:hypothetical protein|nr:hypothetical protein [Microbacterium sp.]
MVGRAQLGLVRVSTVIPLPGGGIEMQVRPTWPLWFVLRSDPDNAAYVRGHVYAGFDPSTPPNFETANNLGDLEIDDWEGAPLDMVVHSSQHERLASLGPEMVEILRDVSHQVQAAIDGVERS